MKLLRAAFIVMSLYMLGCEDSSESPQREDYPDLRTYLHRFEDAAKNMGYDFDLGDVQILYVDKIEMGNITYCGYGFPNYDGAGLRRIEISTSAMCGWSRASDAQRENLIFHEIGHAFFNRAHNEAKLCDGNVASLMTKDIFPLTAYTGPGEARDYYIAELIDPLIANTKCVKDEKDWTKDPVLYKLTASDNNWILYTDNGKYVGTRSIAGEAEDYLALASIAGADADENAYWFKSFVSPNIPECAELKFRVRMNSESLAGAGAAISIRAYESVLTKHGAQTEQYFHVSTENNPVKGELDDVPQELVIPCYTRATTQLLIFVVLLGHTQGKVTFNDIEVLIDPT